MNKDEIIEMLSGMILRLQKQLDEANRKAAEANQKADALLEEVSALRKLLEEKNEEENKQKRVMKGLAKISQNKSE